MGILIQNTILKFSKTKIQTQKEPLKFQKINNMYKEDPYQKRFIKQTPPKVEILIENTISKFSKTKGQIKKRPP